MLKNERYLLDKIRQLLEDPLIVSNSGSVSVSAERSSTAPAAAPVNVTSAVGGTTVVASNANRYSVTLQNVSTVKCYIRCGGDPTSSAYNIILAADTGVKTGKGGVTEIKDFTGEIKAITESGTATIAVTEIGGV